MRHYSFKNFVAGQDRKKIHFRHIIRNAMIHIFDVFKNYCRKKWLWLIIDFVIPVHISLTRGRKNQKYVKIKYFISFLLCSFSPLILVQSSRVSFILLKEIPFLIIQVAFDCITLCILIPWGNRKYRATFTSENKILWTLKCHFKGKWTIYFFAVQWDVLN